MLFCILVLYTQKGKVAVYGIAFYNLENLFDTINSNGSYDQEFTPQGTRKWDTNKYKKKQFNMALIIHI